MIDAQVHIWAANTPQRPWPVGAASGVHRAKPLGQEELLQQMQAAGVDKVVIVPPSFEGDHNDLALDAARSHPDRFAVMGRLQVEEGPRTGLVQRWRQQPGMLGVRLTFHRPHQQTWLSDGTADWFWAAAEEAQVPVMVFAPEHLPAIGDVARRHPGLRLTIDHLGLGLGVVDDAISPALEGLWPLADHANVAVKASALPAYVTEDYPYPSLRPHIKRVVSTFGPERVFWGTDFTRLKCSYRQAVTHFTEELDLTADEQRLVMGEALQAWLGWTADA